MTSKEQKQTVVALTLEPDERKRSAIIDELSGSDAREMLKMVFRTIRGEYAADFDRETQSTDLMRSEV